MKLKKNFLVVLATALVMPVAMLFFIVSCVGTKSASTEGPCDIFAANGTPCVSAHSTTRALYASYTGPLYQVMRQSDGQTLDIGVVQPANGDQGGYADAAAHDSFCENNLCWISVIYDQSSEENHLYQAPPGTFIGPAKGGFNTLPIADMAPVTVMGHKAYGTYIMPGTGLRNNDASGLAINDDPEGIYMVFDGTHYDSGCCFNYGNTSTNSDAVGRGTMSTVYFGTSTAWGSGAGTGPWIMSDMEAGLFSGYNTKQNEESPTIDSWRFVTGMVNGGGGNVWEIRGGNAQDGELSLFYKGIRPQSEENSNYYPMRKKGSIQLGNGGDNGNGSAGTFYEGVITSGYPTDAAINAVQANIVAARYDVQRVGLSRVTTFTHGAQQEVTVSFTNTTGRPAKKVKLSVVLPSGWNSVVAGTNENIKTFSGSVATGETVTATFNVTSPESMGAGYIAGKAEWKNNNSKGIQSDISAQRIRNVIPVKINEVRLSTSSNSTNQFIELYNAADTEADISNWSIINTLSQWAPVKLATIPEGTKIQAKGFYLLGMASSGLASSTKQGESNINVINTTDFRAGQQIEVDGEIRRIQSIGTPASAMTTIFVPVSTGPWLTVPAGSSNIPVKNTNGFVVGQKIGIDKGGNYDEAIVTEVGKASTQTILAVEAKAGETIIKVNSNANLTIGDKLTISTGARKEIVEVKRIIRVASESARGAVASTVPGEIELAEPLQKNHMLAVDVSSPGTGISFSPATRFEHKSGDAVQALGSGIKLDRALDNNHEAGAPVINTAVKLAGYQDITVPNQWYGDPLSLSAGSIALMDASGEIVIDAMVYGSQQTNSGANGQVTNPELAILEGIQSQGGNIVVVPASNRNSVGIINRSFGRFPDGTDNDSNIDDFKLQNLITLLTPATSGANNIKIANTSGFAVGQQVIVGSGSKSQIVSIAEIGTTGGTTVAAATGTGATFIPVASVEGFYTGQSFTIGNETATVASVVAVRRRANATTIPVDTIKVTQPLANAYTIGTKVYGKGITFNTNLTSSFETGTPVLNGVPTPGSSNQYN